MGFERFVRSDRGHPREAVGLVNTCRLLITGRGKLASDNFRVANDPEVAKETRTDAFLQLGVVVLLRDIENLSRTDVTMSRVALVPAPHRNSAT
jgi:hypothetical protein